MNFVPRRRTQFFLIRLIQFSQCLDAACLAALRRLSTGTALTQDSVKADNEWFCSEECQKVSSFVRLHLRSTISTRLSPTVAFCWRSRHFTGRVHTAASIKAERSRLPKIHIGNCLILLCYLYIHSPVLRNQSLKTGRIWTAKNHPLKLLLGGCVLVVAFCCVKLY